MKGTVAESEIIDNLERLGIKCVLQESAHKTIVIDDVRMGSSGYYGGVDKGDVVQSLRGQNNLFLLTISRAGKIYQISLKPLASQYDSSTSKPSSVPIVDVTQKTLLAGQVNNKPLSQGINQDTTRDKVLKNYDIELIIDITGSMMEKDGTGNQTKFEWCRDQVRNLAQRLSPYQQTVTITTFSDKFQTEEQCGIERVEQIYGSITPSGNTDLVDPLKSRLEAGLNRQEQTHRPLLIAVITDGLPNVPNDPSVVNKALIAFTQGLKSRDQVELMFLQIGDTFTGRDFCVELDDGLLSEGAKFDIVDTKPFADLKQEGLVNALIDAVKRTEPVAHAMPRPNRDVKRYSDGRPANSSNQLNANQEEISRKQSDRAELEKQLLGQ